MNDHISANGHYPVPSVDELPPRDDIASLASSAPVANGQSLTAPVFRPLGIRELLALPAKQWLIKNVLGVGDLGMIYGPSGGNKTFIAIDLIIAACSGKKWASRFEVMRPLTVAYCAGEGIDGLAQRFQSAIHHYGIGELSDLEIYLQVPQLYLPSRFGAERRSKLSEDIVSFIQEHKERVDNNQVAPLDLLIIDTLHSATTGADENSAGDVGQILAMVKQVKKELGCAVLLVHHTNKTGTAERGSSALRGAMDVMISLQVKGTNTGIMSCEKLKDGAQWEAIPFTRVAAEESAWIEWGSHDLRGTRTQHEAKILDLLQEAQEGLTCKAVAESVGLKSTYASKLLSGLVEAGIVTQRLEDPEKRKSSRNAWIFYVSEDDEA